MRYSQIWFEIRIRLKAPYKRTVQLSFLMSVLQEVIRVCHVLSRYAKPNPRF
ncbi:MAG: hypothetical protein OXC07_01105 [Kistimonas sp.]|nr:hypothetical protein [Kistimonas sp.]